MENICAKIAEDFCHKNTQIQRRVSDRQSKLLHMRLLFFCEALNPRAPKRGLL
jgi:hypothetical protein